MKERNIVETVNVSKLITTSGTKVHFQTRQTSRAPFPQDRKIFTASASPSVYYISLVEPTHIILPENPPKK